MAVEHDFSWRVAVTSIYKGFKSSPDAGLEAIKNTVKDLDSQGKSDFSTVIQMRVNPKTGERDLFWEGYERSISESMRRYVAFLKVTGASEERIGQAKVDWQVWRGIRDAAVDLQGGQSISFLALRDVDPRAGVALQMVSNKNGSLVLSSSLLPFDDLGQINLFTNLLGTDRQQINLGIDLGDSLSPLLTWVVKGSAIDFKKDLPGLIDQSTVGQVGEVGRLEQVVLEPVAVFRAGAGIGWRMDNVNVTPIQSFFEDRGLAVQLKAEEVSVATDMSLSPVVGFWFVSDVSHLRGVRSGAWAQGDQWVIDDKSQIEKGIVVNVDEYGEDRKDLVQVDLVPVSVPLFVPLVISEIFSETVVEEVVFEAGKSVVDVEVEEASDVSGRVEFAEPTLSGEMVEENVEAKEEVVGADLETQVVTGVIPVSENSVVLQEEIVTESTEITEGTEVDVQLGSGPEPKEEVITEDTEVIGGTEELEKKIMDEKVITESIELQKIQRRKIFSAFTEVISVPSVIGEVFNEQFTEQQYQSIKAKIIWLQRHVANVVADGLIGKILGSKKKVREEKTDKEMIAFSLLINSLAMMQFDGVEERPRGGAEEDRLVQFRLSPMRIWADRVKNLVRATKERFRQTSLYVYKHIFLNS